MTLAPLSPHNRAWRVTDTHSKHSQWGLMSEPKCLDEDTTHTAENQAENHPGIQLTLLKPRTAFLCKTQTTFSYLQTLLCATPTRCPLLLSVLVTAAKHLQTLPMSPRGTKPSLFVNTALEDGLNPGCAQKHLGSF